MEIIVERLEREFDLGVITTSPSVIYRVVKTDGSVEMIQNPTNLPPAQEISYIDCLLYTSNQSSAPASISFVPSAAGLLIASEVIKDLIEIV